MPRDPLPTAEQPRQEVPRCRYVCGLSERVHDDARTNHPFMAPVADPAEHPSGSPQTEAGRDLTMADLLDTLRWITEKDGSLPAKGSDREQRLIDLWTRRLILPADARREPLDVDAVRSVIESFRYSEPMLTGTPEHRMWERNEQTLNATVDALSSTPPREEPTDG